MFGISNFGIITSFQFQDLTQRLELFQARMIMDLGHSTHTFSYKSSLAGFWLGLISAVYKVYRVLANDSWHSN